MGNRRTVDIRAYLSPGLSRREPPPPEEEELPKEKRIWQKWNGAITLINEVIAEVTPDHARDCSSAYERAVREQQVRSLEQAKSSLILAANRIRMREPLPEDFD